MSDCQPSNISSGNSSFTQFPPKDSLTIGSSSSSQNSTSEPQFKIPSSSFNFGISSPPQVAFLGTQVKIPSDQASNIPFTGFPLGSSASNQNSSLEFQLKTSPDQSKNTSSTDFSFGFISSRNSSSKYRLKMPSSQLSNAPVFALPQASSGNGTLKQTEMQFEWVIPDFKLSLPDNKKFFDSPMFLFSGTSWFLRLYPEDIFEKEWMSLYLHNIATEFINKNVTVTFSLKKTDGTLVETSTANWSFKKGQSLFGKSFWKRDQLLTHKSELMPFDTLTLICRIWEYVPLTYGVSPNSAFTELETLSKNFRDLFTSKIGCDVTIKVKNVEFQAHRAVLIARSPVLAAMFGHDMAERQTGEAVIPDCDPDSFEDFLGYLYTGKIENISFENAHSLYLTADKYAMDELKSFCVSYMKHHLEVSNVCDVITLADQYEESQLMSSAQNFFNKNVNEILDTPKWEELMKQNYRLANRLFKGMACSCKFK